MSKILSIIIEKHAVICMMTKIICRTLQYIWSIFFLKRGGGGMLKIQFFHGIFFRFEI